MEVAVVADFRAEAVSVADSLVVAVLAVDFRLCRIAILPNLTAYCFRG